MSLYFYTFEKGFQMKYNMTYFNSHFLLNLAFYLILLLFFQVKA